MIIITVYNLHMGTVLLLLVLLVGRPIFSVRNKGGSGGVRIAVADPGVGGVTGMITPPPP